MSIGIRATIDAVASHAAASGLFDSVNTHEPKNAPGGHLSCDVWVASVRPYAGGSGLAGVSAVLTLNVQLRGNMLQEPQDSIDMDMVDAADVLMAAYSSHFTLGGNIRNIDLLGEAGGQGLTLEAGYLEQDRTLYRVLTITLPMVINDVWTEAP